MKGVFTLLNKKLIVPFIVLMLLASMIAYAETTETSATVTETTTPSTTTATAVQASPTPQDTKLASAINKTYNTTVTAQDIAKLHAANIGYGEISKAYGFAALSGKTVSDVLGLKQTMGWGEIAKSLGVKVSDVTKSDQAAQNAMNTSKSANSTNAQSQTHANNSSSSSHGGSNSGSGGHGGGHGGGHH
jgi:uncharacterized membrane protein YgcG